MMSEMHQISREEYHEEIYNKIVDKIIQIKKIIDADMTEIEKRMRL